LAVLFRLRLAAKERGDIMSERENEAELREYEKEIKAARARWPEGPWSSEPDRIEWRAHGLPCLMVRSVTMGAWCGYVGVPPGHPFHGKGYDDVDVAVHGGLTYGRRCGHVICHVPQPGEPADVHWLGLNEQTLPHLAKIGNAFRGLFPDSAYRDVAYVKAEVERLAKQIVKAAR
jgi:hypothetical protein